MKIEVHLLLCISLQYASSQLTSHRHPKAPCEARGTALVEQFFNIIFIEFHLSPPACVCVQMCPDQPTYCYPNGCFKRTEKKRDTPVSKIQHEGAKTMFLVDNDKDFFADVMGNGNSVAPPVTGKPDNSPNKYQINRPNPFKEIVFKYKRLPKLEIRYNLREQVKQTMEKRAEVDVSKTRWPINKQLNKQAHKINQQRNSNYITSTFSETNQPETPKYFKRYLTKRENQNSLDIGALYLYKDASNFSLETLIDNLIEKGLEGVNSTLGLKISKSSELRGGDNKSDPKFMNSETGFTTEGLIYANDVENSLNQNNSKNGIDVINATAAAYFEIITTLSNEIEKQNLASMKAMKHFSGSIYDDNSEANISNKLNLENASSNSDIGSVIDRGHKSLIKKPERKIKPTTNKIPTSLHKEFIPVINGQVKKSKQRIVRKLRNRKLN